MDDFDLTGIGAPPRPAWPEPARLAVGCGSGCALLVLLEFGVIWLFVTFMLNAHPPEGLEATATAPRHSVVGKAFPLKLTIRNEGESAFTVRSISAQQELLRKFNLDQPAPAPLAGKTSLFGRDTWAFNRKVEPKETWTVTFQATPREEGKLTGNLDLQVNSVLSSVSFTTTARAAAANRKEDRPADAKAAPR